MFGVRIHGRGGQGVVTAAELLSVAGFIDGHEAQAFPSFGSERMGAPVTAFCRLDDRIIRLREPVTEPDCVIVGDATLLHHVDVFAGLRPGGFVLVNSTHSWSGLGLDDLLSVSSEDRLVTLPATDIARRTLGRPLPNPPLLGAFCALTATVGLDALERALEQRFSGALAQGNLAATREGFVAITERLIHA